MWPWINEHPLCKSNLTMILIAIRILVAIRTSMWTLILLQDLDLSEPLFRRERKWYVYMMWKIHLRSYCKFCPTTLPPSKCLILGHIEFLANSNNSTETQLLSCERPAQVINPVLYTMERFTSKEVYLWYRTSYNFQSLGHKLLPMYDLLSRKWWCLWEQWNLCYIVITDRLGYV